MKKSLKRFFCAALIMLMLISAAACNGGTQEETLPSTEGTSADTEPQEAAILEADLTKYALVRPEKVSDAVLEKISDLFQKMKSKYNIADYKDDFHKEGVPMYSIGEFEIIVGDADRPETREFLSELKCNDFGYKRYGDKIVIAGHSDEATIDAIQAFVTSVLNNKNGEAGVFYKSEYDFIKKLDYKIDQLYVGDTHISEYCVVYPKKNGNSEKITAQMIADAIASASGYVIEVKHDGEGDPAEYEILVGGTNRHTAEELAAMSADLGATEALLKYDGKRITAYGSTSTAIIVAANEFTSKLRTDKTEKLSISLATETLCKYNDSLLTAMSFNVWVSGKTPERIERVLTMVRNYYPDTIGFQEVDSSWLSSLNSGLKDQYAYVGEGRDGGSKGEYNPIFYKKDIFNLIDSGTRWLSSTPDRVSKVEESSLNRVYTYALLERKTDGTRVMVVNTHFEHTGAAARDKQAKVLVDYLRSVTDYPIVLTGDFNCQSNTDAYSTVISGGVSNSFDVADKRINQAATFTNFGSSNKIIDYVFVSPKGIAVTSYKVCNEMINGDFPSDHHPVLIEYTLLG